MVTDYQKTGIIATLSTVATITNNTVTGDGAINYIAQNGIQVSSAATAKLVGNNVSLNNYSPAKVTACGLLIYKAGGVSGATKSGLAFIKADNDFHDQRSRTSATSAREERSRRPHRSDESDPRGGVVFGRPLFRWCGGLPCLRNRQALDATSG